MHLLLPLSLTSVAFLLQQLSKKLLVVLEADHEHSLYYGDYVNRGGLVPHADDDGYHPS